MARITLRLVASLAAVLALLSLATAAEARRVALVIGNGSYQVGPLANPVNDAEAVAAALGRLGFDKVELKTNLGTNAMRAAISAFGAEATGADIAVLYFAGHGMENGGANYLIPVDAKLARAADADLEAIRLGTVLEQLDGARKLKLVILDACRNTVFPLAGAKRATARGLARIEPENNTLIAYAAKEGTTADDGTASSHSPFTAALLRHIETPGAEVDYIFRSVRDDVYAATGNAQTPHLYGTLGKERIYLKVPEAATGGPSAAVALSEAERAWSEVKGASSPAVLESFVRRYGDSFQSDLARARLEELKRHQTAAVAPTATVPVPPSLGPPTVPIGPRRVLLISPSQEMMDVRGMPSLTEWALKQLVTTAADLYEKGAPLSPVDVLSIDQDGQINRLFTGEEAALDPKKALGAIQALDRTGPKTPDFSLLRLDPATRGANRVIVIMDGSQVTEKNVSEVKVLAADLRSMENGSFQFVLSSIGCFLWQAQAPSLKCTEIGRLDQKGREAALLEAVTSLLTQGRAEPERAQVAAVVPPQAVPPAPSEVQPTVGVFEQERRPGETFRDCPECPEMVVVPAGSFTMGSPASEESRAAYEGPQRTVTIAKPFAVGRFEVTFAEWDACASAGGCTHNPNDVKLGRRGRQPVINVSWNDAKEYVAWLSKKSGKSYRLLTEAEWEYAARAGTTTSFSTGETITTDQANFNGNYTYGGSAKGEVRGPIEVGSFKPNAFGLHDMHGNVREWVKDCWIQYYKGAPADGAARTTACTEQGRHVVRGGSWYTSPDALRSAHRLGFTSDYRTNEFGFRVARTLSP